MACFAPESGHLQRDCARRCHICCGTALAAASSAYAPGMRPLPPHPDLHWDFIQVWSFVQTGPGTYASVSDDRTFKVRSRSFAHTSPGHSHAHAGAHARTHCGTNTQTRRAHRGRLCRDHDKTCRGTQSHLHIHCAPHAIQGTARETEAGRIGHNIPCDTVSHAMQYLAAVQRRSSPRFFAPFAS